RDFHVTGVQTCALPISTGCKARSSAASRIVSTRTISGTVNSVSFALSVMSMRLEYCSRRMRSSSCRTSESERNMATRGMAATSVGRGIVFINLPKAPSVPFSSESVYVIPGLGPALPMEPVGKPRGGVFEKFPRQLAHILRLRLAVTKPSDQHADDQGCQYDGQGIFLDAFPTGPQRLLNAIPGVAGKT